MAMEEETIFRMRARLFIMNDGVWQLRGVGNAKLLRHKTTQRTRLVMLKHMSTQAIANQFVQPEAVLLSTSSEGDDRNRAFVFEADDYATGKIEHHTFAIRFKTEEDASGFYTAYTEAQVQNAIIAGGGVPSSSSGAAAAAKSAAIGSSLMSPGAASEAGSRVGGLASPAAPPQPPTNLAPVARAAEPAVAAIPASAAASAAPSAVPSVASTPLRQPPVSSAAAVAAAIASAAPAPAAATSRPAHVQQEAVAPAPAAVEAAPVKAAPAAAAAAAPAAAPAAVAASPSSSSGGKSWFAIAAVTAFVAGGAYLVAAQQRPTLAADIKDAVEKGLAKVKEALKKA